MMTPLTAIYFASLAALLFFLIYVWRRVTRKFCIIITDSEIDQSTAQTIQRLVQK